MTFKFRVVEITPNTASTIKRYVRIGVYVQHTPNASYILVGFLKMWLEEASEFFNTRDEIVVGMEVSHV